MEMRDLQIFAIFVIVIIMSKKIFVMVRWWGAPLLYLLIAVGEITILRILVRMPKTKSILLRHVEIVIQFIT